MVEVSRDGFKNFCFDLIGSETKLDIVVKEENEKGIRAIYCEVPTLSKLKKEYPDIKDLYNYVAKNIKDKCFHICEYNKKRQLLVIDGSKYEEIIIV